MLNPPKLLRDNISVLHMTKNLAFHEITKHIGIDYYFVREKVCLGHLTTKYVPSSRQVVDIFTKPLSKFYFKELRRKWGGYEIPSWGRIIVKSHTVKGSFNPTILHHPRVNNYCWLYTTAVTFLMNKSRANHSQK